MKVEEKEEEVLIHHKVPPGDVQLPAGTGRATCLYGRIKLVYWDKGKRKIKWLFGQYDDGSQDSYFCSSINHLAYKVTRAPFVMNTMAGCNEEAQGKRGFFQFELHDGTVLDGSAFEQINLSKAQINQVCSRWTAVPSALAKKHNLEDQQCYLGSEDGETLCHVGGMAISFILGQPFKAFFPQVMESFVDEFGSVTLSRCLFTNETLIEGARITMSEEQLINFNEQLPAAMQWQLQDFQACQKSQTSKLTETMARKVETKPTFQAKTVSKLAPACNCHPSDRTCCPTKLGRACQSLDLPPHSGQLSPWAQKWLKKEPPQESIRSYFPDPQCTNCTSCARCNLDKHSQNLKMREIVNQYQENISLVQKENGVMQFCVKYLWVNELLQRLPINKEAALHRLECLEKSLDKLPKDMVDEFVLRLNQGLEKGWWKIVTEEEIKEKEKKEGEDDDRKILSYVPLAIACKQGPTSTSARIILDVTLKTNTHNPSVADCQISPPKLQRDIGHILLQLRCYPLLAQMDIEKMFYNILVHSDDSFKTLFFARQSDSGKISLGDRKNKVITLRPLSTTMGLPQSPPYSRVCLRLVEEMVESGDEKVKGDSIVAEQLRKLIYLDDGHLAVSLEEAQQLLQQGGGLNEIFHLLALRSATLEYHLRKRHLQSKGYTATSPISVDHSFFGAAVEDILIAWKEEKSIKAKELKMLSPSERTPIKLGSQSETDTLLGWTLSCDQIYLAKQTHLNLSKARRGCKNQDYNIHNKDDFLKYAKSQGIKIRQVLALVHSFSDTLNLSAPVKMTANILYRRILLEGAMTKPQMGKDYNKKIGQQHYNKLGDLVDSILEVRRKPVASRYLGPPVTARDVVMSLFYLSDGAAGLFSGYGATLYLHTSYKDLQGKRVSKSTLVCAVAHLNSATKVQHQLQSELRGLNCSCELAELAQSNLAGLSISAQFCLVDSRTCLQLAMSSSVAFELKAGLIVSRVQATFKVDELFYLPGEIMQGYADKVCREHPHPHQLMDHTYFGGGLLSQPIDEIREHIEPASKFASFDTSKLPLLNTSTTLVRERVESGGRELQLTKSKKITQAARLPSPTSESEIGLTYGANGICENFCKICSNQLSDEEKKVCDRKKVNKTNTKQAQNKHLLSNLPSPAGGQLPCSLLPMTICQALNSSSKQRRQKAHPQLQKKVHASDSNPLAYIFDRYESAFKALRLLCRARSWIYKFRKQEVPSMFSLMRECLISTLQLELQNSTLCHQQSARGRSSDILFEEHRGILWAKGRRQSFPVQFNSDVPIASNLMNELPSQDHHSLRFWTPVLCAGSAFTKALMRHFHRAGGHLQSPTYTKAIIENQFHIQHASGYLKKLRKECARCRILAAKPVQLEMGPDILDHSSLTHGVHFQIDLTGHWTVCLHPDRPKTRGGKAKTCKVYVLLGVCLYSRKVFGVVMPNLKATTFLSAVQALFARQGSPTGSLAFDPGSSFLGGENLLRLTNQDGVQKLVPEQDLDARADVFKQVREGFLHLQNSGFNCLIPDHVPTASFRQGRIESSVRAFKKAFYRSVHSRARMDQFSFSHLVDTCLQCVNDRPIAIMSDSPAIQISPNILSGYYSGMFTEFGNIPSVDKVFQLQQTYKKAFHDVYLKFMIRSYRKMFHKQISDEEQPQINASVLILDKVDEENNLKLAAVDSISHNGRVLNLRYIPSSGRTWKLIQRPTSGVALIANPSTTNTFVHFDPLEEAGFVREKNSPESEAKGQPRLPSHAAHPPSQPLPTPAPVSPPGSPQQPAHPPSQPLPTPASVSPPGPPQPPASSSSPPTQARPAERGSEIYPAVKNDLKLLADKYRRQAPKPQGMSLVQYLKKMESDRSKQ